MSKLLGRAITDRLAERDVENTEEAQMELKYKISPILSEFLENRESDNFRVSFGRIPMNIAIRKIEQLFNQELRRTGEEVIGEDEDDRYYKDFSGEIVQDYEDACDKETRNELRKEQRKRLYRITGGKDE